ncbi:MULTISPECIES: type II toxin-antitoxin system HigB family toxin [Morganellaceae]|nr:MULTISPECIES: type II toxin-antitoxin system HigB family toxin [Morganellaceae]ELB1714669.1 type II toxin-antitoxin system HigB family toxin [Proteus mirabilis]MBB6725262.1 type II toxin-antitoxin system HigB family toxin [Proteus mirabilis]MBG3077957.1 type II toxin-antitoxin system HigB family toxin [Proteus mirabilis]MBI6385179.1 type II toxin-antitoxin system HigB family toxin [Proteus mirabilis]MCL8589267.1 type II toxin-antitoxin system HigB family toxin [Proteus mirabilis]
MAMRLLGRDKLEKLVDIEPSCKRWSDLWSTEIAKSYWKSKEEVEKQFPTVINLKDKVYLFQVSNTNFKVETIIDFSKLVVLITSIKGNVDEY